jgi:hypothetical protein
MHPTTRASHRATTSRPGTRETTRIASVVRLGVAIGALVAAACSSTPRTEVFVRVIAEPGVERQAASLTLGVRGAAASSPDVFGPATTFERRGDALAFPLSIGIVPKDGDSSRRFEIVVSAMGADGTRVGEARARGTFVEGRTHLLELFLEDACIDTRCMATETCRAGVCEDAEVDVASLPLYEPGAPPDPRDAGVDRVSLDADTDDDAALDAGPSDLGADDAGGDDAGGDDAGGDDAGGDDAGGGLVRPPSSIWAIWELPGTPTNPRAYAYDAASTTVLDLVTGLEWERTASSVTRSQTMSATYCSDLLLDGKDDWRLPSRIELASIADYERFNPSVDPGVFPDTFSRPYWTRSPVAGASGLFWVVNFTDGVISRVTASTPHYTRCVR